jgi:hypothetical protein
MSVMKTTIRHTAAFLFMSSAMFLAVSCGTSKKASDTVSSIAGTSFSASKHLEAVVANKTTANAVTAKMKIKVEMSGKEISTSGTLRMKRGEVVQMSLLDPLLGVAEVMRMEFTRDKVLIVDRLNRRYVEETYSGISYLKKANLDFNALEALFWNEVFLPKKKSVVSKDFVFDAKDTGVINMTFDDDLLTYKFVTDNKTGELEKTQITTTNGTYSFNLDYAEFKSFEGKNFPMTENINFTSGNKKLALVLRLSSLRANSDWETKTAVSNKYSKISASAILNALMGR